jgi:hypothetical protein
MWELIKLSGNEGDDVRVQNPPSHIKLWDPGSPIPIRAPELIPNPNNWQGTPSSEVERKKD